jgi:Na+/melibiose symporter-like transporter
MILDAVDENELETGQRLEGLFVSIVAFAGKVVSGVGNLLGGVALELIDFPSGATPGTVPQSKIDLLGWAVGPGLVGFYSLGYLFLRRYDITRERHHVIVAALARRRAPGPVMLVDPGERSTQRARSSRGWRSV